MKKTITFLCLLFVSTASFSQVTKANAGYQIFANVFGTSADPDDYPASKFPNPYIDIQQYSSNLEKKLIILSYLDYDDGKTVFYNNQTNFYGNYEMPRIMALAWLLEAYDIAPSNDWIPYTDIDQYTAYGDYARKAYSLGIIPYSTKFNPWDKLSYSDFDDWLDDIKTTSYHPVSQSRLKDLDNYFIPNNFQPSNLSLYAGIEKGVFDHYAKNSFVIPDRKLSLNFSHYYSSKMVELPSDFYPIQPLARGWTHTYNAYIYPVEGDDDYFYIVWPDGTIHIYNDDESEYESLGVYDDFDEKSSTRIVITTKDQTEYEFRKLDTDRDLYYLYEIEDRNGNDIDIRYENAEEDDTKRIEYVESPSGKRLLFTYKDDEDLIERITDPIDRKIYFDYSKLWSQYHYVLVEFDDAKGNRTVYQYKGNPELEIFLLKEVELPEGNIITADYTSEGKLDEYTINDETVDVDWYYDYDNGDFEMHTDIEMPVAIGRSTQLSYEYNTNGLLSQYSDDNSTLTINYPTSGSHIALPDNIDLNSVDVYLEYDSRGNVIERDIEHDFSEYYQYNSDNTLERYTDQLGNRTYYYYDNDGNLTSIKDPLNNYSYFTYDQYGQMTSSKNQENIEFNFTYESDGALEKVTGPVNTLIEYRYDGINRLLEKTVNGYSNKYTYDKNDNVVSYTNSMNYVTGYDYDKNDNLTKVTNAKNGKTYLDYDNKDRLTDIEFGNSTKEYEYDDEGYLKYFHKPNGDRIRYRYDSDGRLTDIGDIEINYDTDDRIEYLGNSEGNVSFTYDEYGRTEEVEDGTNNDAEIRYYYRDNSQLSRIKYDDGDDIFETYYTYDANNRLIEVFGKLNGILYQSIQYSYLKDGRISSIDYPNNLETHYSYDDLGRVSEIRHINSSNGENFFYSILERDIHGNLRKDSSHFSFTGFIPGSSYIPSNYPISYTYSNTNKIENQQQITWDGSGLEKTDYIVDINGNLTNESSNSVVYDYDDFDNLLKREDDYTVFSYKYNALGQRIEADREYKSHSQNNHTTKYVRDVVNDNVLVEIVEHNGTTQKHFLLHGLGLAARITSSSTQYFHYDTRGSTVLLTNEQGTPTKKYLYDENGQLTKTSFGPLDNRYCYVGQYGVEYEDRNLMYMRKRYYHPKTGRFLSEDPVWSTNLYPYADNNPVNRIDPNGKLSNETIDNYIIPSLQGIVNVYHISADILGLVPGFGEVADGYNALLYSIEGDYINAGLSGAAAIPFIGWGATTGKYVNKVDALLNSVSGFERLKGGVSQGYLKGNLDKIYNSLINQASHVRGNLYRLNDGTFINRHKNTLDINRNGEIYKIRIND